MSLLDARPILKPGAYWPDGFRENAQAIADRVAAERGHLPTIAECREILITAYAGSVPCGLGDAKFRPGRTRRVPPNERAYEYDSEAERWGDKS